MFIIGFFLFLLFHHLDQIKSTNKPAAMDVYYVDLTDAKGEEMGKKRPCVIVTRDDDPESIFQVVPLTSKTPRTRNIEQLGVRLALLKKANHPGLGYDSLVIIDEIRSVDITRMDLRKRVTVLTEAEMRIVVTGIPLVLQKQKYLDDHVNSSVPAANVAAANVIVVTGIPLVLQKQKYLDDHVNSSVPAANVAAANVYMINLGPGQGKEAYGNVPGVIVQRDDLTSMQKTALFVPLQNDIGQEIAIEKQYGITLLRLAKRDHLPFAQSVARIDHISAPTPPPPTIGRSMINANNNQTEHFAIKIIIVF